MDAQRRDLLAVTGATILGAITIPIDRASASTGSNNTDDSIDTVGSLSMSATAIDAIGSAGYSTLLDRIHTAEDIDIASIDGTAGIRADGTAIGLATATGEFDPAAFRSTLRSEGVALTAVADSAVAGNHDRVRLSGHPLAIEITSSTVTIARDRSAGDAASLLDSSRSNMAAVTAPETELEQQLSGALVGTASLGPIGRSRLVDRLVDISEPVAEAIKTAQSIGIAATVENNTATVEYGAVVDPTAVSVSSIRSSMAVVGSHANAESISVKLSDRTLWITASTPVDAVIGVHTAFDDRSPGKLRNRFADHHARE